MSKTDGRANPDGLRQERVLGGVAGQTDFQAHSTNKDTTFEFAAPSEIRDKGGIFMR